jgi:hypothetical protein
MFDQRLSDIFHYGESLFAYVLYKYGRMYVFM